MMIRVFSLLLLLGNLLLSAQEPDGSRHVGPAPPYKAQPAPPAVLRTTSHALAFVDTKRYLYEAYAGSKFWLVRYVMLPEEGESFREIEQVFEFPLDGKKGKEVDVSKVEFQPKEAKYKGETCPLVDKRDLQKP